MPGGADYWHRRRPVDATKITWVGTPTTDTLPRRPRAAAEGEDARGSQREGIDRGCDRYRHWQLQLSEGAERTARHEVQGHPRVAGLGPPCFLPWSAARSTGFASKQPPCSTAG